MFHTESQTRKKRSTTKYKYTTRTTPNDKNEPCTSQPRRSPVPTGRTFLQRMAVPGSTKQRMQQKGDVQVASYSTTSTGRISKNKKVTARTHQTAACHKVAVPEENAPRGEESTKQPTNKTQNALKRVKSTTVNKQHTQQ